jgi:hypothetical protein
MMAKAIRKAYPLEDVAKVATASLVNTALVLSENEDFKPKLVSLTKELTPVAVQAYMQGPPTPSQTPGQALANQRWGNPRGSAPLKLPQAQDPWVEMLRPIAEPLIQSYAQKMISGQMGGNAGAASSQSALASWRPPV